MPGEVLRQLDALLQQVWWEAGDFILFIAWMLMLLLLGILALLVVELAVHIALRLLFGVDVADAPYRSSTKGEQED